jgi:hypothetical protein
MKKNQEDTAAALAVTTPLDAWVLSGRGDMSETIQGAIAVSLVNDVLPYWGPAPANAAFDFVVSKKDEDYICERMFTLDECLRMYTEDTARPSYASEKYKALAHISETLGKVLVESDPIYEQAYFCLTCGMAYVDEFNRGIGGRTEASMVIAARISLRCFLYLYKRLENVYKEARLLREQMIADPAKFVADTRANQPEAAVLVALTEPPEAWVTEIHTVLYNQKQSTNSKGRRSEALEFARAEFERMYQSGGDTKDVVLAKMIVERMAQAQIAKPVAEGTVSRYIPGWRSNIEQRLRVEE